MPDDMDPQETDEDPERSQQYRDQGISTRKTDSMSSSITEADFIAARNVAYGCLSAIEKLSIASRGSVASGHIAPLGHLSCESCGE
jgi:hypothetical protein